MRFLVTGGSGFIGSRLVQHLLEAGHQVRILDLVVNEQFAQITTVGDVRQSQIVNECMQGVDAVIHLAAQHRDDVRPVSLYYDVNVEGMRRVVEAMEANDVKRIVFTSTVALYGLDKPSSLESDTPDPFNDYGRSKWQAEQVLNEWYARGEGKVLTIIRPCVIFGEGNRGNVYNLAKQVASGKFLQIGNGLNRKSMGYVGNIVAMLAHSADAKPGSYIYNYADKPDLTTRELVALMRAGLGRTGGGHIRIPRVIGLAGGCFLDLVARLTGRTFPISMVRIKKFTASTVVDATKLEATGFVRPFTIEEGLKRTMEAEFGLGK